MLLRAGPAVPIADGRLIFVQLLCNAKLLSPQKLIGSDAGRAAPIARTCGSRSTARPGVPPASLALLFHNIARSIPAIPMRLPRRAHRHAAPGSRDHAAHKGWHSSRSSYSPPSSPNLLILRADSQARNRPEDVEQEFARVSGPRNSLSPILFVPVRSGPMMARQYVRLAPTSLTVAANLQPQERKRGWFHATVYEARIELQGTFLVPDESRLRDLASDRNGQLSGTRASWPLGRAAIWRDSARTTALRSAAQTHPGSRASTSSMISAPAAAPR